MMLPQRFNSHRLSRQRSKEPRFTKKQRFNNTFERDLFAMRQVWKMLKTGTIRWFGEVGRQY
tara:strand:+ start:1385 stop:1570 length:186 start_codon:yes stop_codon:yes gene_type:complete